MRVSDEKNAGKSAKPTSLPVAAAVSSRSQGPDSAVPSARAPTPAAGYRSSAAPGSARPPSGDSGSKSQQAKAGGAGGKAAAAAANAPFQPSAISLRGWQVDTGSVMAMNVVLPTIKSLVKLSYDDDDLDDDEEEEEEEEQEQEEEAGQEEDDEAILFSLFAFPSPVSTLSIFRASSSAGSS